MLPGAAQALRGLPGAERYSEVSFHGAVELQNGEAGRTVTGGAEKSLLDETRAGWSKLFRRPVAHRRGRLRRPQAGARQAARAAE